MPYMQPTLRAFDATRPLHRVMHTLLLALAILCTVPLQPRVTQASEHLHTGVIPTVGIHEITEGALLFRTAEPGKFIPRPDAQNGCEHRRYRDHCPRHRPPGVHESQP